MSLSMNALKVLAYPLYEVVFECTFDDLVEEIRRQELIDVGSWEMCGERLVV